ncbi:MAG: hypothetical protein Q9176_006406 [Flavoplaca citrina]
MPYKRRATSHEFAKPRKSIKRERLENETSGKSARRYPARDATVSPTAPAGTTDSFKQSTVNPTDTDGDADAPISRRTRLGRMTCQGLFDNSAPSHKPAQPIQPTSDRNGTPAPRSSPDLDMEFLTGHIIALKERAASLEHENEDLKTLNQELKKKYEVLAERVAGLADLLRREA